MTNNNLFFLCSLIEFIGRQQKLSRNEVVSSLGLKTLRHIYDYSDVLHCEPISKVADEYIESCKLKTGNFDNITSCKYAVPSYWDIGKVYARLVQDVKGNKLLKHSTRFIAHGSAIAFLILIRTSFISRTII